MSDASRDGNFVTTLLGVSNADGVTPIKVYADPVTHRLLVDTAAGSGTVTSVSVVTANGFAGTVANPTTTPAITLTTTITGILKGNGTAISAASASTDYAALAFKTISVSGQSDVVADSPIDTLTLVGSGITITTNAGTDTITFTSSGGTPAGNNKDIQFNDSASFGGVDSFIFDKATNTITLGLEADIGTLRAPNATTVTAVGGEIQILAGSGGATSGAGGSLNFVAGGALGGNSAGGDYAMLTGSGHGNAKGGDASITAGNGGATGNGGVVTFRAGSGGATSGTGGEFDITSGDGGATGNGGALFLETGWGGGTAGNGGHLYVAPGSVHAIGDGGDVKIGPGNGAGGGVDGKIRLFKNNTNITTTAKSAILDVSLIASSDKTFVFPNADGTIALTTDAANITVGTSTITGGTTTRILYDNSGVLGEYTISGTGTVVAMASGPTLTSPTIQTLPVLASGTNVVFTVPTVDDTATGDITNVFNSGYSSSAIGDLVYLDSSSTWQKADADASATTYSGLLGIALEVQASGAALKVLLRGFAYCSTAFPTFTIGGIVYMSATAAAVTQTAPTTTDSATRILGYAVHADKMWFSPSNDYITHT